MIDISDYTVLAGWLHTDYGETYAYSVIGLLDIIRTDVMCITDLYAKLKNGSTVNY